MGDGLCPRCNMQSGYVRITLLKHILAHFDYPLFFAVVAPPVIGGHHGHFVASTTLISYRFHNYFLCISSSIRWISPCHTVLEHPLPSMALYVDHLLRTLRCAPARFSRPMSLPFNAILASLTLTSCQTVRRDMRVPPAQPITPRMTTSPTCLRW